MILIVFGLPGSGKSFFAEKLAKRLGASYLSSDRLRRLLFSERTYSMKEKHRVYDRMLMEMKELAKQGRHVVLDGTFFKKGIRKRFIEEAQKLAIQPLFIEVKTKQATSRQRLALKREHSEADYSVYLKIKSEFEPYEADRLILESRQDNIDEMIEQALNYVKRNV